MADAMSVLVLIPARGGSKRLPGKNLRTVGGISLVGHAIRCGRAFLKAADIAGAVMCDTDSSLIAAEARVHGANVPFLREREYAEDWISSAQTVVRTLDRLAKMGKVFDTVVLLQPTSPLRIVDDVEWCWREHERSGQAVGTYTAGIDPRRPNGAVYVIGTTELREQLAFNEAITRWAEMPAYRSVDIDTAEDLAEAERLWRLQHGNG